MFVFDFFIGEDVWSYAKGLPQLFQQGGVFYSIMKKTTGIFLVLFYSFLPPFLNPENCKLVLSHL